jgi:YD repeat-containing protein
LLCPFIRESITSHGFTVIVNGQVVTNGIFGSLTGISSFHYDLLGRLTQQTDGATYSRTVTYNAKGQITVDDSTTLKLRTTGTVVPLPLREA